MEINRSGREEVYWGFKNVSGIVATPQLKIDRAVWVDMSWYTSSGTEWDQLVRALKLTQLDITAGTSRIAKKMIAGPEPTSNPEGTIVLQEGRHVAKVRLDKSDQILVRSASIITITP